MQDAVRERGGDNRSRKIAAMEALRKALEEATICGFTGSVGVEVTSNNGNLNTIKVTAVRWPPV
jgi:hypothetical protein